MNSEFQTLVDMPALGRISVHSGMKLLTRSSDGLFEAGRGDITSIVATGDGKVEFVAFKNHTLAHVTSALDYPAYYPVSPVTMNKPVRAVLMDLDGTTVHSEQFWIRLIEKTMADLLGDEKFSLEAADERYVSGHSVSEHFQYCLRKYCQDKVLEDAMGCYSQHMRFEMNEIAEGRGDKGAFVPVQGVKEFLVELKARGIKIGLVTSGLYERVWPELSAAFELMKLGDPKTFYDTIITAGTQPGFGMAGTMGELSLKPHPWLYAEAARIGLGISIEDRNGVIGIEDSGAGVCSIRLAGFSAIGIAGGNIVESGTKELCYSYRDSFEGIMEVVRE